MLPKNLSQRDQQKCSERAHQQRSCARSPPQAKRRPASSTARIWQHQESGSAAKAAAALWQEHDIEISKSTAWRILTSDGFAFRVFRRVPLLLPIHKAARVKFSQHYSDKGFSYWSQLMFTDSKYFTISSSSGRIGHYELTVAPPSTVPTPKRGAASLHVYMGCTVFGLTEMVLVSGGSLKNANSSEKMGVCFLACPRLNISM